MKINLNKINYNILFYFMNKKTMSGVYYELNNDGYHKHKNSLINCISV